MLKTTIATQNKAAIQRLLEKTPYSVTRGKHFFDWKKFLNQETISQSEWNIAFNKASGWIEDACGNLPASIPRYAYGRPIDNELAYLGIQFQACIMVENKEKALTMLDKIEFHYNYLKELELIDKDKKFY